MMNMESWNLEIRQKFYDAPNGSTFLDSGCIVVYVIPSSMESMIINHAHDDNDARRKQRVVVVSLSVIWWLTSVVRYCSVRKRRLLYGAKAVISLFATENTLK